MSTPTLIIGDKNKSSWSLRPWLALKQAGVAFTEQLIVLDQKDTKANIKAAAPLAGGKVPVLIDDDVVVWESLAICEYIAERWAPSLWPRDQKARAHARSISNEMHAGFANLRSNCPFNIREDRSGNTLNPNTAADVMRISQIWRETKETWGGGGPFLFGHFTIADAMYAPVVSRFTTYGIFIDDVGRKYMQDIWAMPAMQEWKSAALAEQ